MKAQTLVYVAGTQYAVGESIEQVKERWIAAGTAVLNDQGATVDLTNVTGYFDPYAIALAPNQITALEEMQPMQVRYTEQKTRERWGELEKELEDRQAGFGA